MLLDHRILIFIACILLCTDARPHPYGRVVCQWSSRLSYRIQNHSTWVDGPLLVGSVQSADLAQPGYWDDETPRVSASRHRTWVLLLSVCAIAVEGLGLRVGGNTTQRKCMSTHSPSSFCFSSQEQLGQASHREHFHGRLLHIVDCRCCSRLCIPYSTITVYSRVYYADLLQWRLIDYNRFPKGPKVVPFWDYLIEFLIWTPNRNYFGAFGYGRLWQTLNPKLYPKGPST